MRKGEAYPSKFLQKEDVGDRLLVQMQDTRIETLQNPSGHQSDKPVLYLADTKPMVLAKTNWLTIEALYGPESDHWHGKWLELYRDDTVQFAGQCVGGIRVRARTPSATEDVPEAVPEAEADYEPEPGTDTEAELREALTRT